MNSSSSPNIAFLHTRTKLMRIKLIYSWFSINLIPLWIQPESRANENILLCLYVLKTQKTRAGVCKTLFPQHLLVPKYGQICSAVIPQKWILLKRLTGNLLIIPHQLTKFQNPSSNLPDKVEMPEIGQERIDRICSKVNQVIYSSHPMSWPNFKPLAQIVFLDNLADKFKMPKFSKGHNSGNIWTIFPPKFNQVIYFSSPIVKLYLQ